jgi:hypothetical protein
MTDAMIVRLATETVRHLQNAISVHPALSMVPSYNAVLAAARANHPEDPFLAVLAPLPTSGDDVLSIAEVNALFAQIAIVVQSLAEEKQNGPRP